MGDARKAQARTDAERTKTPREMHSGFKWERGKGETRNTKGEKGTEQQTEETQTQEQLTKNRNDEGKDKHIQHATARTGEARRTVGRKTSRGKGGDGETTT